MFHWNYIKRNSFLHQSLIARFFYPICLFHIKPRFNYFLHFKSNIQNLFSKKKWPTRAIILRTISSLLWDAYPMYTSTKYNKLANKTLFKFSLSVHIKCGFCKKSFIMNAPLVSWAYLSSLLGGFAVAPTPKWWQICSTD